jgi:hypothetical protein
MARPPQISVKFVGPDDKVRPGRKPTRDEIGLRYAMSQFYSLKVTLEALFGRPIYMELKETANMTDWRRAAKKLLDAIALSIKHTVRVADDDWFEHMAGIIVHGQESITSTSTAADLFSVLTAILPQPQQALNR